MIILHHPHGVGTGSNPGNTVGGGILIPHLRSAGDDGLIRRLCVSLLNELNDHLIGGRIIVLHRAADGAAGVGVSHLIGAIELPDMPISIVKCIVVYYPRV